MYAAFVTEGKMTTTCKVFGFTTYKAEDAYITGGPGPCSKFLVESELLIYLRYFVCIIFVILRSFVCICFPCVIFVYELYSFESLDYSFGTSLQIYTLALNQRGV